MLCAHMYGACLPGSLVCLACPQIWRLPSSLCGGRRGEEALLRKLAAADDAMEALRSAAS